MKVVMLFSHLMESFNFISFTKSHCNEVYRWENVSERNLQIRENSMHVPYRVCFSDENRIYILCDSYVL